MVRASHWSRLAALDRKFPPPEENPIIGICRTSIHPETGMNVIHGLQYTACAGYSHPLDGIEVDFDPPIARADVETMMRHAMDVHQRQSADIA